MNRIPVATFLAGLLAAGLGTAAHAEEPVTSPAPPGPAAAAPPPAVAAAPAADPRDKQIEELRQAIAALQKLIVGGQTPPAKDPRDEQIEELKKVIAQLQTRVEELEKRPAPPVTPDQPAAPTTPTSPPASTPSGPGATFLPNISIVGNLIAGGGDTDRVPNRGRFNFTEFELAFQDAVTSKMRYDVFLSAAKEEEWKLGMEEGYLTATALYPGLNARFGRIRTPFGKFNPLHPHSWPFITQPSAMGALLGPEGMNGDGAVAEYTFPTKGFFLRSDIGIWQTASETEDGLGFAGGGSGAYSGRLWLGKELDRDTELELGFSRYQGNGDVEGFGRRRLALNGMDLTWRRYMSQGRMLKASAELIDHVSTLPGDDAHRIGGFAYLLYRMSPFWEAGIRGDYTRFPVPIDSYDWGGSLFLTKYLTEQTSLRLEYQYTRSPLQGTGNGIYFQILFGSGPHSHNLQ